MREEVATLEEEMEKCQNRERRLRAAALLSIMVGLIMGGIVCYVMFRMYYAAEPDAWASLFKAGLSGLSIVVISVSLWAAFTARAMRIEADRKVMQMKLNSLNLRIDLWLPSDDRLDKFAQQHCVQHPL